MEKTPTRKRKTGGGAMEENTLAILDSSYLSTDYHHLSDDRFTFLEAVRSCSIVPDNASAPTDKMYEAVFQILKDESSLDLIMASYQLLKELDKRFPRISMSETEKSESSSSPSTTLPELVVVEEGLQLLIQDLGKGMDKATSAALDSTFLRSMLLLQYLVNVLEGDFLPRNSAFKKNMNWILLRESLLNMLLGSRRIIYKGLIKDCLSVMCKMSLFPCESPAEVSGKCDTALAIALPEIEKCTCLAVRKFLLMIMELDSSKKAADIEGLTTRSDGVRTPAAEIILDELTYDRDILSPFFQVFDEPKWKLDIVVQYLRKYITKSSVRTRRSNGSTDDATFHGVLKCFSNSNNIKSITKKIGPEVAQLLLAHAFQAYLLLPAQHSSECIPDTMEGVDGGSLEELCKNLISAFTCLRKTDEHIEILPFGKEAIFTAAAILSRK